jgi:pilus assembly protein CpaC
MKKPSLLARSSALALLLTLGAPVQAESPIIGTKLTQPGQSITSEQVTIGLNKSMIVDLDRQAADVVITNPEIADAVVQTSKRLIFRGVSYGQTNAYVFDGAGNQILNLEIAVEMDMTGLHQMIQRHVPNARVNVEGINGNVVLTGNVASLTEADQVQRLVAAYLKADEKTQLVNMLTVNGKEQVMLEVRIVEMQRSVIKQLGINVSGRPSFGDLANLVQRQVFGIDPNTGLPGQLGTTLAQGLPFSNSATINSAGGFPVQREVLAGFKGEVGYTNYVGTDFQSSAAVSVEALERIGVVRTLAEPNIVALSGESAKFLAGGEFPVPVGQSLTGAISVEFKPYGVGLAFTPVVLSEGRISLKISTEVSELSSNGAFQGQTSTGVDSDGNLVEFQGLTIPALTVRRAESVIELPSGGSMMMAGLIQARTRQSLDQLPGLKKLPVLGALFQSRDFIMEESELVVIVTPYLVDPTAKSELKTPQDGYANASDARTIFLGKINETYGKDGKPVEADSYRGPVGFIEE